MKYINAQKILPACLLQELQQYAQGSYLYIPVREGQHKEWGELSGYRESIDQRNAQIIRQFRKGMAVEELSAKYFLSVPAIRKIIYSK